jgi:hypothetical protein
MILRNTLTNFSPRSFGWRVLAVGLVAASVVSSPPSARAQQSDDAMQILKTMTDYLIGQKTISMTFDSDIEVITTDLQKIQFTSSGRVQLSRPDKIRATRTGGYADLELVFDGKTVSIIGKNENKFVQADIPGSVDQLMDRLIGEYNVQAPGATLLRANVFDELTSDVIASEHIGRGVVDGVECEHLAFRDSEVDWQIWVELGARPIPRKLVITSKAVTGAPQYTMRIKEWGAEVPTSPEAFAFKPPPGAAKVAIDALANMDEVPPGVVTGGKK